MPKAEEGKCIQQVYEAGHLSREKQRPLPPPPHSRNAEVLLAHLPTQQTFPLQACTVSGPGLDPGGGGVSEMNRGAHRKVLQSQHWDCGVLWGQTGKVLSARPWSGDIPCREWELSNTIKQRRRKNSSGLYKDHSGRITENGDTRLEDQGSGGSDLIKLTCFDTLKNRRHWIIKKRADSHFIHSEEELRRNWKV